MAEIAAGQHGNVTTAQLRAAGLSPSGIRRRVVAGRLHPELHGVYRVGHRAPSLLAHYAAAVLAAGPGAVLAGRAAARLHELLKTGGPAPEVATTRHRKVSRVLVRRVRSLAPEDVTVSRGIPCTSVARTLVDLAGRLTTEELADLHHVAGVRHRVEPDAVLAALARRPNARGAANLKAVVVGDLPALLSRLEKRFRAHLAASGFPLPGEVNKKTDGRCVDCRFAEHRFTVELDGYLFHRSRKAWEADRQREREAYARGDAFRRFTWRDVVEDTTYMDAVLADHLPRR